MKPGTLIGGKYRLTRQIGSGAMGVVWAATNESIGREVALKLIVNSNDELRLRLVREGRACGGLRQRNIIELYDVGQTDEGDPFLVMQLLSGETLAALLKRMRRLEPPHAARVARDVALALVAAHGAGVIHRDLKPANIYLNDEADDAGAAIKVVKVLDFGVAKKAGGESDGLATMTGGLVGSPAYMSPEQANAQRDLDYRSDLWSLGVVLFELLTGVRPFQGDENQVRVKIMVEPVPLVSRFVRIIDPGLVAIVSRCLERDLTRRVQSAAELVEMLRPFTSDSATSASGRLVPAASIEPPAPPPARAVEPAPPPRSLRYESGHHVALPAAPAVDDDEAATARLNPKMLEPKMLERIRRTTAQADGAPQSAPRFSPSGEVPAPRFSPSGEVPAPRFSPSGEVPAPPSVARPYTVTEPLAPLPGTAPNGTILLTPQPGGTERLVAPLPTPAPWRPPAPSNAGLDEAATSPVGMKNTIKMTPDYTSQLPPAAFSPVSPTASSPALGSGAWPAAVEPSSSQGGATTTAALSTNPGGAPLGTDSGAATLEQSKKRRTMGVVIMAAIGGLSVLIMVIALVRRGHSATRETNAEAPSASASVSAAPTASASAAPSATGTGSAAPVASVEPTAAEAPAEGPSATAQPTPPATPGRKLGPVSTSRPPATPPRGGKKKFRPGAI